MDGPRPAGALLRVPGASCARGAVVTAVLERTWASGPRPGGRMGVTWIRFMPEQAVKLRQATMQTYARWWADAPVVPQTGWSAAWPWSELPGEACCWQARSQRRQRERRTPGRLPERRR